MSGSHVVGCLMRPAEEQSVAGMTPWKTKGTFSGRMAGKQNNVLLLRDCTFDD